MKLGAISLAATFLLGMIPAACHAQDFSADVVYLATNNPDAPSTGTGTSPQASSKLYVSKDKMRLETHGLTSTVLLVNGGEHTAIALFPVKKAYQLLPAGPSQYFRAENAEDACADWQKASAQKIVCEKVGHEMVDGRQAVKYKNKATSETATAAVWIDLALRFVIKWEGADTGAELRNIKQAQQPADLFVVPSGYETRKPQKGKSNGFTHRSQ